MPHSAPSRWCPTPEQLMILEEMYRSGIKSPNTSQIQNTTALLSLYGKIEGKNVFYWFQNHKARDRQKLRRRPSRMQQLRPQKQKMAEISALQLSHQSQTHSHHQDMEFTQVMNFQRKLETTRSQSMEYQPDEWIVLMDSKACVRPPLRTLELFPISSTGLEEDCKASES